MSADGFRRNDNARDSGLLTRFLSCSYIVDSEYQGNYAETLRWLRLTRNLRSSFRPVGARILNTEDAMRRIKARSTFLNADRDKEFRISIP